MFDDKLEQMRSVPGDTPEVLRCPAYS